MSTLASKKANDPATAPTVPGHGSIIPLEKKTMNKRTHSTADAPVSTSFPADKRFLIDERFTKSAGVISLATLIRLTASRIADTPELHNGFVLGALAGSLQVLEYLIAQEQEMTDDILAKAGLK